MNDWRPDNVEHHVSDAADDGIGAQTLNQLETMVDMDCELIEVKLEPDIKDEPEALDYVVMVSIPNQRDVPNVKVELFGDSNSGIHNDGSTIGSEDFGSAHVKLEHKAEKVKADAKPEESKQTQPSGNSSAEGISGAKHSTKDINGHKTLAAKLKSIEARGRAKSVINAAHRKQTSAKRTKKQHKCSSCGYVTPRSSHLKMHMRKHTGEQPFPCNICAKRFTQKSNLQAHLKTHTDELPFICSVCLERFLRNEDKLEHEARCNGRRFECHLCKKFTTSHKYKLKRHMRMHTDDRLFQCNFCSKEFEMKIHLKRHSDIHTNPRPAKFQCLVCARNFYHEVEKKQHELKCKRRRFECYICKTYVTAQKTNLSVHMRVHHTGVKPFQCEVCKKSFTQETNLMQHQIHNHK